MTHGAPDTLPNLFSRCCCCCFLYSKLTFVFKCDVNCIHVDRLDFGAGWRALVERVERFCARSVGVGSFFGLFEPLGREVLGGRLGRQLVVYVQLIVQVLFVVKFFCCW